MTVKRKKKFKALIRFHYATKIDNYNRVGGEEKEKRKKFSPLRIMFAVGLSYIAFLMLRYVPSIPAFWRVFILNGC